MAAAVKETRSPPLPPAGASLSKALSLYWKSSEQPQFQDTARLIAVGRTENTKHAISIGGTRNIPESRFLI